MEQTNKRSSGRPLYAFLLSLLTPGLGQIYSGKLQAGLALFFTTLIMLPLIYSLTSILTFFSGFACAVAFEIILRISIIIHAVILASRQKDYIPKSYNKPAIMASIAIGMVLISKIIMLSINITTFKIVSASGEPTLKTGDRVVAETGKIQINYGDLVAYTTANHETWLFRVIGLPNDTIAMQNNTVLLNNKICEQTLTGEAVTEGFKVNEYEEVLPNGRKHKIYTFQERFSMGKSDIPPTVIPEGHYYLLGDNRDNAMDSRFTGFVKAEHITGRILYSFWGQTSDRINVSFQ